MTLSITDELNVTGKFMFEDNAKRDAVVEEVADVLLFALLLADRLDIDVGKAIVDKLASNEQKYPVALARGNARKYTELREP